MDIEQLTRLLNSRTLTAKLLGAGVVLFMFVPDVARVAGNPDLTFWNRVEQISLALGRTLGTIALAAVPPENFSDKEE